jgi:putative membrane protein
MRLRTTWMSFSLVVVLASAVLIALTVTPAVSLAGTTSDGDVSQTAVDAAATLDARPAGGAMEPAPATLQRTNGDDHDWDTGWWIVMPIMMVLFWGGVLGVAIWGIRQFTKDRGRDRNPLDIAKERLAKGEITKEEFDRIRGDLA